MTAPAKPGPVIMGDMLLLRVDNRRALVYASVPPFGHRIHDPAMGEWSMMD
jgi:hypothetical protein